MITKGIRGRNGYKTMLATALGVALIGATAGHARAGLADSCGLSLGLDYPSGQSVALPGDTVRTRITLGTGAIHGGTKASVEAIRFFLQCNASASKFLPCVQDGAVIAYGGDETIASSCVGVTWKTGHKAGPRPNQIVLTPDAPVEIPANTPDFCYVEFDVTILGASRDSTPNVAEQMVGLGFSRPDASCDNGLRAVDAVVAGIHLGE